MITLIVAFDENYNIGKNNTIPWHFSEDLANFKKITTGNVCIMGKNTWESLPPKFRPLPNRTNIIVSSSYYKDTDKFIGTLSKPTEDPLDAFAVPSLEDALDYCKDYILNKEIFIIGGSKVYQEVLCKDYVDKMIVTKVKGNFDGDVTFPVVDWNKWEFKLSYSYKNFEIIEYYKI